MGREERRCSPVRGRRSATRVPQVQQQARPAPQVVRAHLSNSPVLCCRAAAKRFLPPRSSCLTCPRSHSTIPSPSSCSAAPEPSCSSHNLTPSNALLCSTTSFPSVLPPALGADVLCIARWRLALLLSRRVSQQRCRRTGKAGRRRTFPEGWLRSCVAREGWRVGGG